MSIALGQRTEKEEVSKIVSTNQQNADKGAAGDADDVQQTLNQQDVDKQKAKAAARRKAVAKQNGESSKKDGDEERESS